MGSLQTFNMSPYCPAWKYQIMTALQEEWVWSQQNLPFSYHIFRIRNLIFLKSAAPITPNFPAGSPSLTKIYHLKSIVGHSISAEGFSQSPSRVEAPASVSCTHSILQCEKHDLHDLKILLGYFASAEGWLILLISERKTLCWTIALSGSHQQSAIIALSL